MTIMREACDGLDEVNMEPLRTQFELFRFQGAQSVLFYIYIKPLLVQCPGQNFKKDSC
jgi:hypothetical protein